MDLGLKDKVVLVTGGGESGGIGGTISTMLASEGAIPVIISRTLLPEVYEEKLYKLCPKAAFFQAELEEESCCKNAVAFAVEKYGCIDGLVNNAALNDQVGLQVGLASFRKSLERNLVHYYAMVHFSLPYLKKSRGSIVNISSKVALTGQGGTSGYAASKGAILALTREWAAELIKDGIRVNAVIPAEVMTPSYDTWLATFPDPVKKLESITTKIPLENRMTKPEEIASTVLFLLSRKSSHTTGQWLFVDGGYVHLDRALL